MVSAIIVSAGAGLRMGSEIRKQYLNLGGRPVLGRCLEAFVCSDRIDAICLVVPATDMEFCRKEMLNGLGDIERIKVIPGGEQRHDSVYNGLRAVSKKTDIVLIQDGVRPFTTPQLIDRCLDGRKTADGCILAIPAVDTLKKTTPDGYIRETIDRSDIWMAQTPQAFRFDTILQAYEKARKLGIGATDDARLVEMNGGTVVVTPGSRSNIKITTPEDLQLAEAMIRGGLFP